jgi:hypothetical protein
LHKFFDHNIDPWSIKISSIHNGLNVLPRKSF